MERVIASGFVPPDGVMEAPDRPHFPYRGDEMGEHRSDELRIARDG